MRLLVLGLVATALSACGAQEEEREAIDARVAQSGFTPPSVTSRVDWGTQVERRFHDLDRNQDDQLTPDELPRETSRIANFDANGDKIVSEDEFSEGAMARFDRMDLNKDGTVTSEEQRTSGGGALPAR